MTGMLASVTCLTEARQVHAMNVDIIDLKEPSSGALGALDQSDIREICSSLDRSIPISATIGDLPMVPERIFNAVRQTAECGVDYVKIGFFPQGEWQLCLQRLESVSSDTRLIAVLFADCSPDIQQLVRFKKAGFEGVMLDTRVKQNGSLTNLMSYTKLHQFIQNARQNGLLTGLAGSLRQQDIASLMPLQADYLGFRGALCHQHNRVSNIDLDKVNNIRQLISESVETN